MNTVAPFTELTEIEPAPTPTRPKPYRDPIMVYGVSLLIVAALSFYGGFTLAVDRKRLTEDQFGLAIGRACIEYVTRLRLHNPQMEAPIWVARNCERIAQRSLERMNGMAGGTIRK